jgi:hypothetical protein
MSAPRSLPLVAIALAVAVIVAQGRVIAGGDTWADVRYHTEVQPPRLAAAASVHAGRLPLWWDGSGLGVPLGAEPSHGAWTPLAWIASTPRDDDFLQILLLWWAAFGVAVWARRRGAGESGALVAGLLVATSGVMASAALRGALPALAQLPWLGAAATLLGDAKDRRERANATAAVGALLGAIALAGQLAILVDAIAITVAIGARRDHARWLAGALGIGLAIGAVQWIPAAIELGSGVAGGSLHAMPLARFVELIVPGSFGSPNPQRAVTAIAGALPWAPSLFVGVPLLALAAIHAPRRRVLGVLGALVIAALVVGRGGGWPAWLGAPELHLAAIAVVLAAHAGRGLDELAQGARRATLALAIGAALTAIALGALAALRATHGDASAIDHALGRALLDGGLGLVSVIAAVALAWRLGARRRGSADTADARPSRWMPVILALVVAPSIGAAPSLFPVADHALADDEPVWAQAASTQPAPRRMFRPVHVQTSVDQRPDAPESFADAMDTLAGTSAARWGLDAVRDEDPARPAAIDVGWLVSAGGGGVLLDRFGIGFAILPSSMKSMTGFRDLGDRGLWSLIQLPVAPPAAVMHGWSWARRGRRSSGCSRRSAARRSPAARSCCAAAATPSTPSCRRRRATCRAGIPAISICCARRRPPAMRWCRRPRTTAGTSPSMASRSRGAPPTWSAARSRSARARITCAGPTRRRAASSAAG